VEDAGEGEGFGVQGSGTIAGRKLVRAWVRMASCCVVQEMHWRTSASSVESSQWHPGVAKIALGNYATEEKAGRGGKLSFSFISVLPPFTFSILNSLSINL
jgi:hypothetical protein